MFRFSRTCLLLLCMAPFLGSCDGGSGDDSIGVGVGDDVSGGNGSQPPPTPPPSGITTSYGVTLTGMKLTRSDTGEDVPVDGLPLSSNITITINDGDNGG